MSPLPQRYISLAHEEATLPLSLLPLPWPSPLQSPLPSLSPLPTPLPSPLLPPITVPIGHLPLRSPSTIATAVSVALPSAIAVVVALAIDHCRLRHHWPSQLSSLLGITVAVAISHFQEFLPWHSKNCIQPIEAQNAYIILFCLDSGRCTDQSRMTDQVSSGNGQHQCWASPPNDEDVGVMRAADGG